jgi:pilus assembly protein CpaE
MPAIRVVIFNADESFAPALRATLQSYEGVKIVAEVDEPSLVDSAVQRFSPDVLIVHLDPEPESRLPAAGEIAQAHPDLSIFAVSDFTDGQLILSAMRVGVREFLTKPLDPKLLSDALTKVAQKRSEEFHGRLITVLGSAGGVGATSLATNLAVELAATSSGKVAVVDLDYRFGQVATFLDVEPVYTIADLCESPERLESQVIDRTLVRHDSGIYVLARPLQFTQADSITAAHCVGVLSALVAQHHYVVVDGPSRFDIGAKAVLDVADCSLLLLQLLVPSIRNTLRMLEGMQEAGFNLDRVKLVCNRVGRESGNLTVADVTATLNRQVFATIPDDPVPMTSAINFGEPLCKNHSKSKVRMAIRELAERLHAPPPEADEKGGTRKAGSLFGKIFSEV